MLVETKARVGVFAIALGAYLPQFPTLVPEFEGQYAAFRKTLPDTVEVIDGGIVTTKEQSMAAGDKFRAADVDLVILQLLSCCTHLLCEVIKRLRLCAALCLSTELALGLSVELSLCTALWLSVELSLCAALRLSVKLSLLCCIICLCIVVLCLIWCLWLCLLTTCAYLIIS